MINQLPVPVKPSYCLSPFNDQSIASTHCAKLLSPAIRRSIKCHYPLSRAAFQSCHSELHQPSLLIELAAFYCPFKLNQVRPQFGLSHFSILPVKLNQLGLPIGLSYFQMFFSNLNHFDCPSAHLNWATFFCPFKTNRFQPTISIELLSSVLLRWIKFDCPYELSYPLLPLSKWINFDYTILNRPFEHQFWLPYESEIWAQSILTSLRALRYFQLLLRAQSTVTAPWPELHSTALSVEIIFFVSFLSWYTFHYSASQMRKLSFTPVSKPYL